MAGRLFDKLEQEAFRAGIAARTQASMEWFRTTSASSWGHRKWSNPNPQLLDARMD